MSSLIVAASAFLGLVGVLLLLWGRRSGYPGPVAYVRSGTGVLLLGAALAGLTLVTWANTATDTSQFARALLWGDSDVGDVDRCPTRPIRAGGEVKLSPGARFRLGSSEQPQDHRQPTKRTRQIHEAGFRPWARRCEVSQFRLLNGRPRLT